MKHYIYILVILICSFSCSKSDAPKKQDTSTITSTLITKKDSFTAGDSIVLKFSSTKENEAVLIIRNVYGTTVLRPKKDKEISTYKIPNSFSSIANKIHWELILNSNKLATGNIQITPDTTKKNKLETYLGPRSIIAGGTDFSMLVNVPTDWLDNPMLDDTKVATKHQFKKEITIDTLRVKNLVAWTTIFSPKKTGRILITSLSNGTKSKELTSVILPDNASDFTIDYTRNHKYADGNQIITFTSSTIKDNHGNIVSDGTLVLFSVKNSNGIQLQTNGTTINGVAKAKLLHPTKKESWVVTAYVTGAAKSNNLPVDFDAAIVDYTITLSKDNRTITIGPIESFMQQLVPDGLAVKATIYDANKIALNTKETTTLKGFATFNLDSDFYKSNDYNITIEAAGIKKNKTLHLR